MFRFWKPFAVGAQTGWGNLISANQSLQSGGVFALANVLFSKGSIPLQEVDTADYVSETGVVTVTWTENEAVGCDALDHAVLLIYDETTEQLYGLTNDTSREAEELSEVVGMGKDAADLTAFLWFHNGDDDMENITAVSTSVSASVS